MDKKKLYLVAEIVGILGPVFLGSWFWMEKHCGLPRRRSWWEIQGFHGHSSCKLDTDCWLRPVLFGNPQVPILIYRQRGWKWKMISLF